MRDWWSPAEIAEAGLPGLPGTAQGVDRVVKRQGWRSHPEHARRRQGKGGGWQYHRSLFPTRAQAHLEGKERSEVEANVPTRKDRDAAWTEFEALPAKAQDTARERLTVLQSVERLVSGGMTKHSAVQRISDSVDASPRTIWNWFGLVEAVRDDDRLAYLAPAHRTAKRKTAHAECDPEAWRLFLADYLRLERPSLTSCYRRVTAICAGKGLAFPPERTIRRKLEREVERASLVLARDGMRGLNKLYPPQARDKSGLHALECVNADGHTWDVFVRWPDGTIGRPVMLAFQDVYSSRMLSWRIDQSENRIAVMLALGDLVETFGIPDHCVLDNGRGFASKWLTGGIPNRFRFKVKADDPIGVLPQLGVQVHWTIPYSGRSKPIERAFRDLCDQVAKHPQFAGAYVGNRPDAKPENYGSRAVPLDEFIDVVAEGIAEHNLRVDRRSEIVAGRSFVDAFDESYATAPIRKATPEQRRLWLMGVETLTPHRESGALKFMGNQYWAPFLNGVVGKKVSARFDPINLHDGLHVYGLDGRYLGHADCLEKTGFLSTEDGQAHARAVAAWRRAEKQKLAAIERVNIIELQNALRDSQTPEDLPPPETKVVRGAFGGGAAAVVEPDNAPESVINQDAHWEASQRGIELLYPREE